MCFAVRVQGAATSAAGSNPKRATIANKDAVYPALPQAIRRGRLGRSTMAELPAGPALSSWPTQPVIASGRWFRLMSERLCRSIPAYAAGAILGACATPKLPLLRTAKRTLSPTIAHAICLGCWRSGPKTWPTRALRAAAVSWTALRLRSDASAAQALPEAGPMTWPGIANC
jgi:hypothetical protein